MKTLGLDIGTTTISAVVYDTEQGVLKSWNVKNDAFLPGESWERIQCPERILTTVTNILHQALAEYSHIAGIGVTGQMHGILYLDASGSPVSPLFTWQDGRGDLPYDACSSWAQHLSGLTGYALSTGYGMVTHFYNLKNWLIPKNAAVFCTIHDYVAMVLAGKSSPATDPTDADSMGLFDPIAGDFDKAALDTAGVSRELLPQLSVTPCLGNTSDGIPVYTAIGDNQASFLGAVNGRNDAVLINMGTGGQISIYSPAYLQAGTMETRPFPGGWLLVGASLCGGRSYALLERFFRQTVEMVTGESHSTYDAMMAALDSCDPLPDLPIAVTTFQGTRADPSLRGAFRNISEDNFTPVHFMLSILHGMAEELFAYYQTYLDQGGKVPTLLIGSGNALRKNKHLCRIFENRFGCKLILSENEEEAACGAAIYARFCNSIP